MKNIIKYTVAGLLAAFCITGCSDWVTPERVVIQNPEAQSPVLRDNAYYEALRAYKQTKHKLAFGWYGSWTAVGASYQTRLQSAPDSMDIISIWSQWHSLTPEQIADKEAVQKIKGTKVIFTIFLNNLPDEFKIDGQTTDEGIENFARSYCRDSINKYNYDGIDIDYEPGYGASGEFVGHNNEQFKKLITAMSKYVGPKSGTGKLFTIDGVPYAVHTECAELFDYGIVQAYQSTSYWDLQSRFDEAAAKGWKPEQYIFTENFESYWKTGGVTHSTAEGETVNSLLGMARFNPSQGFCAGFGSYHMEYEYAQSSMPYKYMRRAIQDVNPAGGAIKVKLSSSWYQTKTFLIEDDGSLTGSNDAAFSVGFARPISRDITFNVKVDNSLVAAYNEENGTAYQTLDPSEVTVAPLTAAAESFTSEENKITFSTKSLKKGKYLIPVTVEVPEGSGFMVDKDIVFYIFINVANVNIDVNATSVTGVKIEPTDSWNFNCYQQYYTDGANGVWDEDASQMFDGKFDSGWYTYGYDYAWGYGGNFIVEMDKEYEVSGLRWYILYDGDANQECVDVQYSNDRTNWESALAGTTFTPHINTDEAAANKSYKCFQFKKPVKAKYLRVIIGQMGEEEFTSMSEVEIYAPAK